MSPFTPAGGVSLQVCQLHSGMVSRDKLDVEMDGLESRLHTKIAASNVRIEGLERRQIALCGEDGKNGRVGTLERQMSVTSTITENNAKEIDRLKWSQIKWSATGAATGGSLTAAILELIKWLK